LELSTGYKTSSDLLQDDLTRPVQWSNDWQMEFNVQKCKGMHIGHNNPGYKYLMDNQNLQEVSDEKDLGIMIMNDLKSAAQVVEAYARKPMVH